MLRTRNPCMYGKSSVLVFVPKTSSAFEYNEKPFTISDSCLSSSLLLRKTSLIVQSMMNPRKAQNRELEKVLRIKLKLYDD